MKTIRRPKKRLTIFRVFSLLFFVMLISTSNLDRAAITVVNNDILSKAINYESISNQQLESYNENLYKAVATFSGDLTGYAGDCPLCSGVVACKPRINVLKKGIYFDDAEYGKIRMVASSKKYPCGTILRFSAPRVSDEPIIAIVMDRGVGGNDIDLLMESEDAARKLVGRNKNHNFEILREGWD